MRKFNMTSRVRNVVTLCASLLIAGAVSAQSIFTGLGDLPGGFTSSGAWGLSGNGLVAIGIANSSNGGEGFRWTKSTGMSGLGVLLPSNPLSLAYATCLNGEVVVGVSESSTGSEPYRWTEAGGMVGLGHS